MHINRITTCRACSSERLQKLFSLGDQHLTGVFPAINQKHPPKAPLELVLCERCTLVQILDSCEPAFLYGPSYGYRSGLNKSMREHLSQTARFLSDYLTLKENDIVFCNSLFIKQLFQHLNTVTKFPYFSSILIAEVD